MRTADPAVPRNYDRNLPRPGGFPPAARTLIVCPCLWCTRIRPGQPYFILGHFIELPVEVIHSPSLHLHDQTEGFPMGRSVPSSLDNRQHPGARAAG
jgi:hypothetical protein